MGLQMNEASAGDTIVPFRTLHTPQRIPDKH